MVIVVVEFAFILLISVLFSLMKSKQTAVRGSTGGDRPPVPAFIENPEPWDKVSPEGFF